MQRSAESKTVSKKTEPPKALKETQRWLGSLMLHEMTEFDAKEFPILPAKWQSSVASIIKPTHTLTAAQCVAIYWHGYWHYLRDILANTFEHVADYVKNFQKELADPFIASQRTVSWDLDEWTKLFPDWVAKNCKKEAGLITELATIDFFIDTIQRPKAHPSQIDSEAVLYLQPYVLVTELSKKAFEIIYEKNQRGNIIIYRNSDNVVTTEILSQEEFNILKLIEQGITLPSLMDTIIDRRIATPKTLELNMARWFQKWSNKKIIATKQ